MRKSDDSTLSPEQYISVSLEADKALRSSGSYGRFPTPVDDVMAAANINLAEEDILDLSILKRFRKKAGSKLKAALSKVLGLFDFASKLVFIDKSVHYAKRIFIKLHETGHAILPWQRNIYAVVEDCEKTLAPDIADQFEREANVFASEVIFQLDSFTKEAGNYEFGFNAPLKLSKKYGASIYSSIRQYVAKSTRACTVLVLNSPEFVQGDGFASSLRRVISSNLFNHTFGDLSWPNKFTPDDQIGRMIPLGKRRMSSPREMALSDKNGVTHECIAEAFTQTYQVFILIHSVRTLKKRSIIVPSSLNTI